MKKYLMLNIYKPGHGDCSNGGLSSKYCACYIECERGNYKESEILEDSIVKLEKGAFGSVHLVPVKPTDSNHTNYMFGGCYVSTSDSRWSEILKEFGAPSHCAIALHDRTETWEEYDMLSR